MGEVVWTEKQTEAIEKRNANVLVSAAAGSGKTAVLVERVIRMITREKDPVDIDRFLIMTFTKAAASSMRKKIFDAIRKRLALEPENDFLKKQLLKVHTAKICTIDSLCAEIVRENFHLVDIDPGFRIADGAEIAALKNEIIEEVLEKYYSEGSKEFLDFVNYYIDKNDAKLEEIIISLAAFAESHPEPYAFLNGLVDDYRSAENDYEDGGNWLESFREVTLLKLKGAMEKAELGIKISLSPGGPDAFNDVLEDELEFINSLFEETFDGMRDSISLRVDGWKKAPIIKKDSGVDADLKAAVSDLRKDIKKDYEEILDKFLVNDFEVCNKEIASLKNIAEMISGITIEFTEKLKEAKREKNIADFSDVAHMALEVLIEYDEEGNIKRDKEGNICYTQVADLWAESLEEIIVDEYQDTNMLQEYMVNALSSERFGRPDVFMVGDVKQSIYGFRQARPELFMEKYERYKNHDGGELVVLDANFRSRKAVIDFINLVFNQTMMREVGGIEYKDGHGLSFGNTSLTEDTEKNKTEVLFINGSGEQVKNFEGYEIAKIIRRLTEEDEYSLKDIAIITRNVTNECLEQALFENGISYIKQTKTGFFRSLEINLALDLLKIIDNPYQDIPFAAVLLSPVCMATADTLAEIKIAGEANADAFEASVCGKMSFFEATKIYGGFDWFIEKLEDYRSKVSYMSLSELFEYVINDSGFYNAVAAMPEGESRLNNLDFLYERVKAYEANSYDGLSGFLKSIKDMKENGIDPGSGNASNKVLDAVQLMTIHKSKGLEFPVVILACTGKTFNKADLKSGVIVDADLGLGLDVRDMKTRIIHKTPLMETIREKKRLKLCAEELRLLYVALTRAKDKLIITGTERYLDSKMFKWDVYSFMPSKLNSFVPAEAESYMAFLGAALKRNEKLSELFSFGTKDLKTSEFERIKSEANKKEIFEGLMNAAQSDADTGLVSAEYSFDYKYKKATKVQGKLTASSLEKKNEEPGGSEKKVFKNKGKLSAADRGNAYHRFFELMDYKRLETADDIKAQKTELTQKGFLTEEWAEAVDEKKIMAFLKSSLGKRMKAADLRGKLYREQQFVLGTLVDISKFETLTGSSEKGGETDEEYLLVQGIIDAYIEEDDGLVLIDYKTDRQTDENYYIEKYSGQQNEYERALSAAYGKPVKEKVIYSLTLEREIRL